MLRTVFTKIIPRSLAITSLRPSRPQVSAQYWEPALQHNFSFKSWKVSAFKKGMGNWEPSLPHFDARQQPLEQERGEVFDLAVSFSPFNPGVTRPFLVSGSPIYNSSRNANAIKTIYKPWPYSLPKSLRPKDGTTFQVMYGNESSTLQEKASKPRSIFQAIVYGVPDPDSYSYRKEMVYALWIQKVLNGVPDTDHTSKGMKPKKAGVVMGTETIEMQAAPE